MACHVSPDEVGEDEIGGCGHSICDRLNITDNKLELQNSMLEVASEGRQGLRETDRYQEVK